MLRLEYFINKKFMSLHCTRRKLNAKHLFPLNYHIETLTRALALEYDNLIFSSHSIWKDQKVIKVAVNYVSLCHIKRCSWQYHKHIKTHFLVDLWPHNVISRS
jgi:hypothetical protein